MEIEQIEDYLFDKNLPLRSIEVKVAMIIGIHGLMRIGELTELMYDGVTINDTSIKIQFERKKQSGPTEMFTCLINDPYMMEIIKDYVSMFQEKVLNI